jgi:membrane protein DedA with SNARE-associated domain
VKHLPARDPIEAETLAAEPPETGHDARTHSRKPSNRKFSWRHLSAIALSICISILITSLSDQIRELERLAYLGAFLVMLIGNATVILPVPGLIVVYSLGASLNPLVVGLCAGPGAALGELTGYAVGYGGSAALDNLRLFSKIEDWMERYGAFVITLLSAFPNPVFDVAGLVAGSVRMNWWRFLFAAWIGKTIQCVITSYAGALSIRFVEEFLMN